MDWIETHTHTHSDYGIQNSYWFSLAKIVKQARFSITLRVHYLSCSHVSALSIFFTSSRSSSVVSLNIFMLTSAKTVLYIIGIE